MSNNKILGNVIRESQKINSGAFTINRNIILALCSYFIEGLQYRELKTALSISDGNLASNLKFLIKNGYLTVETVLIDKKNIKIYMITQEGKNELEKIVKWMELIKNLLKSDEDENKL